MEVKISVIIPTYNRSQLVGRALESATTQEYQPAEIIVIDDGSTDDTRTVVDSFGAKVRYVYQMNAGVATARNRGVGEAMGDWIAFLDSDDYWVKEHLANMVWAIGQTQGIAALYFADLISPDGQRYWTKCGLNLESDWEMRRDGGEWAFMRTQPMMLQASVLKKSSYRDLGGLPEQMRTREDTLLFFKLALTYPVCAIKQVGTIMNADDSIRLTSVYGQESTTYCDATVFMYRHLLAELTEISPARRLALEGFLADAYFGAGRVLAKKRDFARAAETLLKSFVTNPLRFTRRAANSAWRMIGR